MSYCHLKDSKENMSFLKKFRHSLPSYNKDRWDILEFLIVHFSLSTASIKWARFQNTSDLLCEAGDRGGVVVWESRKCTNKLTEVETSWDKHRSAIWVKALRLLC